MSYLEDQNLIPNSKNEGKKFLRTLKNGELMTIASREKCKFEKLEKKKTNKQFDTKINILIRLYLKLLNVMFYSPKPC